MGADIDDRHPNPALTKKLHRPTGIDGAGHLVAGLAQMHDQDFEEVLLIFGNEDTLGGHGSPSAMCSWNGAFRVKFISRQAAQRRCSAERAEQFRPARRSIRRELVNQAVTHTELL